MRKLKSKIIIGSFLLLGLVQHGVAVSSNSDANSISSGGSQSQHTKPHKKARKKAKRHSRNYMDGTASYYAKKFTCRKTSSGKRLEMGELTVAHPTLPLGTKLKVTNIENGKSIYVEVNDRMPKRSGHVIDLTTAGARAIGMYGHGISRVHLSIISEHEFQTHEEEQAAKIEAKNSNESQEK